MLQFWGITTPGYYNRERPSQGNIFPSYLRTTTASSHDPRSVSLSDYSDYPIKKSSTFSPLDTPNDKFKEPSVKGPITIYSSRKRENSSVTDLK